MSWRGYFLVSELPPGWTNEQRLAAQGAVHGIGRQSDPLPQNINTMIVSLDGKKAIYEGLYTDSEITFDAICQVIADALSLPLAAVKARAKITYFGGLGSTWEQSQEAVVSFLVANHLEWGEEPA